MRRILVGIPVPWECRSSCGAQNGPQALRLTIARLGPSPTTGTSRRSGGVRFLVCIISAALKSRRPCWLPRICACGSSYWCCSRHPQPRLRNADPQFWICASRLVRRLAQFAPYCEARNGAEVPSTGLACLLILALKSQAPEDW
jgi:hypothetical protein